MSRLSLGIVGLPNVGKSTLFNALVKNTHAEASNYPFCTIDPNVGIVEVPDERLAALAGIVNPEKIVPAVVEFWDIAGIIKGASQGEGLGNKFLANIRETAAIVLVARFFDHPDIIHVNGKIDPKSDLETVLLELILADLESVQKGKDRYNKAARGGDKAAQACLQFAELLENALGDEKPASSVKADTDEAKIVLRELQLLTAKPVLIVANVAEDQATIDAATLYKEYDLASLVPSADWIIPISAKLEAELSALPAEDQEVFLGEYGLKESGLNRLIRSAYSLLGLQTYFTAGPKEVRAWTTPVGARAPQAAAEIHTDFEKGFIRAEVIAFPDYVAGKGEAGAREAGKLRSEGKEYVVQDGDVMHFRFNV
ncbi:MAG TPA: redox-regulated ATPase YchF [Verrucomicrobiae bacterium]|nr:redox-regulated ATPase YchF [Verrucomicrobiae bacterium]